MAGARASGRGPGHWNCTDLAEFVFEILGPKADLKPSRGASLVPFAGKIHPPVPSTGLHLRLHVSHGFGTVTVVCQRLRLFASRFT